MADVQQREDGPETVETCSGHWDSYDEAKSDDLESSEESESQEPPLTLLFVCQESRAVATAVYARVFRTVAAAPNTWVDFKKDTILLDFGYRRKMLYIYFMDELSVDIKRAENLAMTCGPHPFCPGTWDDYYTEVVASILEQIGSVKKLTFVKADYEEDFRGDLATSDHPQLSHLVNILRNPFLIYDRRLRGQLEALTAWDLSHPDLAYLFPCQIEKLERDRLQSSFNSLMPRFEMPTIERKVVTIREKEEVYAKLKAAFDKKKYIHRTTVWLRPPRLDNLMVAAADWMTMGDLKEQFFTAHNILRPLQDAHIFSEVGSAFPDDSIVDDQNLPPNSKLYIVFND